MTLNKKPKILKVANCHGSLEKKQILEKIKELEIEEEVKKNEKIVKMQNKEAQKESFLKCKSTCCCGEEICNASGLQECSICKNVLKSQCNKMGCTVIVYIKPTMNFCECQKAIKT